MFLEIDSAGSRYGKDDSQRMIIKRPVWKVSSILSAIILNHRSFRATRKPTGSADLFNFSARVWIYQMWTKQQVEPSRPTIYTRSIDERYMNLLINVLEQNSHHIWPWRTSNQKFAKHAFITMKRLLTSLQVSVPSYSIDRRPTSSELQTTICYF